MNRKKFLKLLRKEAREKNVPFAVKFNRGKGSHCTVYFGNKATTVKSGELTPMYIKKVKKQLEII